MIFGRKAANKELHIFADLLVKGTTAMFYERGAIKFSQDPIVEKKSIIEYNGRMRAEGMSYPAIGRAVGLHHTIVSERIRGIRRVKEMVRDA